MRGPCTVHGDSCDVCVRGEHARVPATCVYSRAPVGAHVHHWEQRELPSRSPAPGQPHTSTRGHGEGGDTRAPPPPATAAPEQQSDPTPPWVKALYLPDVLQGQLLMPVINYLRAGSPLFLTKQRQPQRHRLRLPGPQAPTREGQDWEGPGPLQKGHGRRHGSRCQDPGGPGRALGVLGEPLSALGSLSLYSQSLRRGPLDREGGGGPPTLLSTSSAPWDRHIWGSSVRAALWSWRLGPLRPGIPGTWGQAWTAGRDRPAAGDRHAHIRFST